MSMQWAFRRGFTTMCGGLLAAFLILGGSTGTASAASADPMLESVEPRLTRADYTGFVDRLQLDRLYRQIIDVVYQGYADDLDALAARLGARADELGRREVEEALAGRRRIDPDELRRMRAAIRRVELDGWAPAAERLETFFREIVVVLTDIDRAALLDAQRALRRDVHLGRRRASESDPAYAGDGVDLVMLVEEAFGSGDLVGVDRATLHPLLEAWAGQVEALIAATAEAEHACRTRLAAARIARDQAAIRLEERRQVEIWRTIYLVNRQYADLIATALEESAGPVPAVRWRDRFDRACFPWLHGRTKPQRQADWILRMRLIDEDVRVQARAIIEELEARSTVHVREARDLLLRARLALQVPVTPRTDPTSLQEREAQDILRSLLQNSGQRARLEEDAVRRLEALLPERLVAQMNADLAAEGFGRRRMSR